MSTVMTIKKALSVQLFHIHVVLLFLFSSVVSCTCVHPLQCHSPIDKTCATPSSAVSWLFNKISLCSLICAVGAAQTLCLELSQSWLLILQPYTCSLSICLFCSKDSYLKRPAPRLRSEWYKSSWRLQGLESFPFPSHVWSSQLLPFLYLYRLNWALWQKKSNSRCIRRCWKSASEFMLGRAFHMIRKVFVIYGGRWLLPKRK